VTIERWLNLFALDLLLVLMILLVLFMVMMPILPAEVHVDLADRRVIQSAQRAGHSRVTIVVRPSPRPAQPFDNVIWADWSCPPRYGEIFSALAFAAAAFAGVIAVAAFRRKTSPGCGGWLLLISIAVALLMAWDAARPNCGGWWY
jgi:hypothetical protein